MASAYLLDLTRSLRRAGRIATGVDRVELAYLDEFIDADVPVFAVVRSAFGYLLLDRGGMHAFAQKLAGNQHWGRANLLSRLPRGRSRAVAQAESDLRRLAVARAIPRQLTKMLAGHLPRDFAYYNVGHSNLSGRVLNSIKSAQGEVHVMVHDVIPLEFPEFQRSGTVAPFRGKLTRVGAVADRVIYNSADTQVRAERMLQELGRVPLGIVSHLGAINPVPDAGAVPAGVQPDGPYFMTIGTIEPRKNHTFLLDLWEAWGGDAPPLLICGNRGWENQDVFARLDKLPVGHAVREHAGLNDGALAHLMAQSQGVLFPTYSEGFGLPPVEALSVGARVLCNDLRVLHEILGPHATYEAVSEPQDWLSILKTWQKDGSANRHGDTFSGYTWSEHFKTVLRLH